MKRLIVYLALGSFTLPNAIAQNEDDLVLTSHTLLTGTARSISLGGSMGAIGGDLSALSINPAGIAVYRSSEFSMTMGVNYNNTKTTYWGQQREDERFNLPLNQMGMVGSYRPQREASSGLISSHFAFTYNRINSFDQNIYMQGLNKNSSMLDMFTINANEYAPEKLHYTDYLAYKTHLIDTLSNRYEYFNAYEDIDDFPNSGPFRRYFLENGVMQRQRIEKNGYAGEYGFTGGINISNQFMIGASVNFQTFRYEEISGFQEIAPTLEYTNYTTYFNEDLGYYVDLQSFDYYTELKTSGTSFNAKIGAIYKPTHQVRIGFAYHSPNYYQINQEHYAGIVADYMEGDRVIEDAYSEFEYQIRTPYKLVGSLAYVGNSGFINVDYEFIDYKSALFKPNADDIGYDAYFDDVNDNIQDFMRGVSNIRIGAEKKINDAMSARIGYGFYGSPFKSEYHVKKFTTSTYSCGLGYRTNSMYVDFSYLLMATKKDFFPYNYASVSYLEDMTPAQVKSKNHQLAVTVGWKF